MDLQVTEILDNKVRYEATGSPSEIDDFHIYAALMASASFFDDKDKTEFEKTEYSVIITIPENTPAFNEFGLYLENMSCGYVTADVYRLYGKYKRQLKKKAKLILEEKEKADKEAFEKAEEEAKKQWEEMQAAAETEKKEEQPKEEAKKGFVDLFDDSE